MRPSSRLGELPHLSELDPYLFQDLCRDILAADPEIRTCDNYGVQGDTQDGIDLLAPRKDGRTDVAQCKRGSLTPADIGDASIDFLKHWESHWSKEKIDRFILMVGGSVDARRRQDAIREEWLRFAQYGVRYEVWSASTLRDRLRPLPRVVGNYLHNPQYWVPEICGVAWPLGEERTPSRARISNIPEPPRHLVGRAEYVSAGAAYFTDPGGASSEPKKLAIVGMPGLGKSVIASAIARSEAARNKFTDGIVWIELGPEVPLEPRQTQLAAFLGSSQYAGFADLQQGAAKLSELLGSKTCLVVLDGVWDIEQVVAMGLNGLSPSAGLLITTQNASVPVGLGAEVIQPEELGAAEGLLLLAEWAGLSRTVDLPTEAVDIVSLTGGLPLALAVIGAMATRRPDGWRIALQRLRDADLDKLRQQFPNYPHSGVLRAIQVSFQALQTDIAKRYLDWAVFPAGAVVPEATALRMWRDLSPSEVQDTLDLIVDRSLLRRDAAGSLSLHEALRTFLWGQVRDRSSLHKQLLAGYDLPTDDMSAFPADDPYIYENVVYHLIGAGLGGDARKLLLNFTWLNEKLARTDIASLLRDFTLLANGEELDKLVAALRASRHVLADNKAELPTQLLGRLKGASEAELLSLLDGASRWRGVSWLRPLVASLEAPGASPLRLTLAGHSGAVECAAVSRDGSIAASGGADHTVRVWDLQSGAALRVLTGHTESVGNISLTPDGQWVASASNDGTVRAWHIPTGQALPLLAGHGSPVRRVWLSPDGRRAASSGADDTLRLWTLDGAVNVHTFTFDDCLLLSVGVTPRLTRAAVAVWDRSSAACRLAFLNLASLSVITASSLHGSSSIEVGISPDGTRAVSLCADHTIRLWDAETGRELATATADIDNVRMVQLSDDAQLVVGSYWDTTRKRWHVTQWDVGRNSLTLVREFWGHRNSVDTAVIGPGDRLVTGSNDSTIRVWARDKAAPVSVLAGHTDDVTAVLAVGADGIVSASKDSTLKVWDPSVSSKGPDPKKHAGYVSGLAVSASGDRVISVGSDRFVRDWDLVNSTVRLLDTPSGGAHVAVSEEGRYCVAAGWNHGSGGAWFAAWDLGVRVVEEPLILERLGGGAIQAVAISPGGQYAAYSRFGDGVCIWNLKLQREERRFEPTRAVVLQIILADEGYAVFLDGSGVVSWWNLETGVELDQIRCPAMSGVGSSLGTSSDWRRLVSACGGHAAVLVDRGVGDAFALEGDTSPVVAAAITQDGSRAISGGLYGTIKVWDLEQRRELHTLVGHKTWLGEVALVADGRRAVSVSADYLSSRVTDTCVYVWDLESGTLLTTFHADTRVSHCAATSSGKLIAAGDAEGGVHILMLEEEA